MSQIFKAICDVMADIGAIGKNQKNQQQGFAYRGIDDVMNALQPAMVKHGIFVVPECLEHTRDERTNKNGTALLYSIVKIRYTFYAEDGSSVQATTIGEGMDSGDKATNKAMAIAFKYACFQTFCIPTKEMVDPDGETHEVKPGQRQVKPADEITDADEQRLWAIAKAHGIDPGQVMKGIVRAYKKTEVRTLSKAQYEEVCARLEASKQSAANDG